MKRFFRHFNWWVVTGVVAMAIVLGVLNNIRVYEEQRVNWFGGPMVEMDE